MKRFLKVGALIFLIGVFSGSLSGSSLLSEWPEPQLEIISRYLPDHPKILEAGGHHGEDTLRMLEQWPDSEIYVFEPNPVAFSILLERVKECPSVYPECAALGSYEGYCPFYIQLNEGNDGASSLYPLVYAGHHFFSDSPTFVACTSLDFWAWEKQIGDVDFMWLDLEGAEFEVLSNGLSLLSSVKVLYVETNFLKFRKKTCLFPVLHAFLERQGFTLLYHVGDEAFQGDAIYVKNGLCR